MPQEATEGQRKEGRLSTLADTHDIIVLRACRTSRATKDVSEAFFGHPGSLEELGADPQWARYFRRLRARRR